MNVTAVIDNSPDMEWDFDTVATGPAPGGFDGYQIHSVVDGWVDCLADDDNTYPTSSIIVHFPDLLASPDMWRNIAGAAGPVFPGGATINPASGSF